MPKFEVEMEIQGFKLRVKGDRSEDFPNLRGEIGKQLSGLLQPPANLLDEPVRKHVESTVRPSGNGSDGDTGRGKGIRRRKGSKSNSAPSTPQIVWQHDPGKWGNPKQSWTEANKTLWLLYVIRNETGQNEVPGPAIVETFNDKFKQFGPLKKWNVPRTMGRLKTNEPSLVMDDTTKSPITWYLTDEGGKAAERLVQEAKTVTDETQSKQ